MDFNLIPLELSPVTGAIFLPQNLKRRSPMNQKSEKALLNLEEYCSYLGIGKTKARELLKDPSSTFTFKIGNRYYANKKKLDQWLDRNSGN